MALRVAFLDQLMPQGKGKFKLDVEDWRFSDSRKVFAHLLVTFLRFTDATGDRTKRMVEGQLSWSDEVSLPAAIAFRVNNKYISGFRLVARIPAWSVTTGVAEYHLEGLREFEFVDPVMVLELTGADTNDPHCALSFEASYLGMPDGKGAGPRVTFEPAQQGKPESWSLCASVQTSIAKKLVRAKVCCDPSSGKAIALVDTPDISGSAVAVPKPATPLGEDSADDCTGYLGAMVRTEGFSLKDLPLIGPLLPDQLDLTFEDVCLLTASGPINNENVTKFNQALTKEQISGVSPALFPEKLPNGKPMKLDRGFGISLKVKITKADRGIPIAIAEWAAGEDGTVAIVWSPVNVVLGPLTVNQVGMAYEEGFCWLLLDATLTLGRLKVTTRELGLGIRATGEFIIRPRLDSITLTVGQQTQLQFRLLADLEQGAKQFTAIWQDSKGVSLVDIANHLGLSLSRPVENLLPTVQELSLSYAEGGDVLMTAQTPDVDLVLAWVKVAGQQAKQPSHTVAIKVSAKTSASLRHLPYFGQYIPAEDDITLHGIEVQHASMALDAADIGRINAIIEEISEATGAELGAHQRRLPTFATTKSDTGQTLFMVMFSFSGQKPVVIATPDGGDIQWVKIGDDQGKQLGPLRLREVGLGRSENTLFLKTKADLHVGNITLGVEGLGIGIPIGKGAKITGCLDAVTLGESMRFMVQREQDGLGQATGSILSAVWKAMQEQDKVDLSQLAKILCSDFPAEFPSAVAPRLGEVEIRYDTGRHSLIVGAFATANDPLSSGLLMVHGPRVQGDTGNQNPPVWVLMAHVAFSGKLSDVPLLHGRIPAEVDVGISGVTAIVASEAPLTKERTSLLGGLVTAFDSKLPLLPQEIPTKLGIGVTLVLPGEQPQTLYLSRASSSPHQAPDSSQVVSTVVTSTALAVAGDAATPVTVWLPIQKTLGPVMLAKIGVSLHDERIWVLFDAGITLAGITLSADGLGLGIPLKKGTSIEPQLNGLGLGYDKPPLKIQGAFVEKKDDKDKDYDPLYEGSFVVQTPRFGLMVIGAYGKSAEGVTAFVFGRLSEPLGGPPFFVVTGLMGGFGYNSALNVPPVHRIEQFPFLAQANSPVPDDPLTYLNEITQNGWVTPKPGNFWLAIGITFDSFQYLRSQVMLAVELGDDLVIALLGRSDAEFPKPSIEGQDYAKVTFGLVATYRSSTRTLAVDGQIEPGSFAFSHACQLHGGFAFYTWFDGSAHPGDFVFTAGGYHPAYQAPTHYPRPQRIGLTWQVDSTTSIRGEQYFAVTPHAVMAGGALEVNYQSDNLRAWLSVQANMLIEWKPFHFILDVQLSVGASYTIHVWFVRKTISVELGATLHLWGPETGGSVTVSLAVCDLTVYFGAPRSGKPELTWDQFRELLPTEDKMVVLSATDGLAKVVSDKDKKTWVATTHGFGVSIRTAIPLTKISGLPADFPDEAPFNIRPMGLGDVEAELTVSLTGASREDPLKGWTFSAITSNAPAALWGKPSGSDTPDLNGTPLVSGILTGVQLTAKPPTPSSKALVLGGQVLEHEPLLSAKLPFRKAAPPESTAFHEKQAVPRVTTPLGQLGHVMVSGAAVWARVRLSAVSGFRQVDKLLPGDLPTSANVSLAVPHRPSTPLPHFSRLVALCGDGSLSTVECGSWARVSEKLTGAPGRLVPSPDHRYLSVLDTNSQAYVGGLTDTPIRPFEPHLLGISGVVDLAFGADSSQVYVTSVNSSELLWTYLGSGQWERVSYPYPLASVTTGVTAHELPVLCVAARDHNIVHVSALTPNGPVEFTTLTTPSRPGQMRISASGALYVTQPEAGLLSSFALNSSTPLGRFTVGGTPTALAYGDDRIAVANAAYHSVTVYDETRLGHPITVHIGKTPIAVAVSRDALYVAAQGKEAAQASVEVYDHGGLRIAEVSLPDAARSLVLIGPLGSVDSQLEETRQLVETR